MESVGLYVEHGHEVEALHQQMLECDRVLGRMEEMLHGFQADLGEISSEIKHLQEDSLSMSIKLKNRRHVEDRLHAFLENAALPPHTASQVLSPNVNEAFQDAVVALNKRLKFLEQAAPARDGSSLDLPPADTAYARALLPELEKLKIKAIAKVREYFSLQFTGLRRPKTNIAMVQSSALLRYAPLFQFIQNEVPLVADDLRAMYIEIMGKTIQNAFKSYFAQLLKLDVPVAGKGDCVVAEEAALKSLFAGKADPSKKGDAFALLERGVILMNAEAPPLLVHVCIAEGTRLPFEAILRSVLKHLVDAACSEFLFLLDFFRTAPKDTFNRIFGRTLAQVLEALENYLLTCYDAVGLLLMIRLSAKLRMAMQRRRVPVLDGFFDRLALLLWPRYKQIVEAHRRSIKGAFLNAGPQRRASIGTSTSSVELAPHTVTRRYAELVASVLILQGHGAGAPMGTAADVSNLPVGPDGTVPTSSGEAMGVGGGGDLMVVQDIISMRGEMVALLERMAATLASPKDRCVFLINNYDLMLAIYTERAVASATASASEEVAHAEGLLLSTREHFAEEEIKHFFPKLRAFVLTTEQSAPAAPAPAPTAPPQRRGSTAAVTGSQITLDDGAVDALIKDFAANWRTGIAAINEDVLAYFPSFKNGMEILKQVLTQLLLYYTRFQDLVKRGYPNRPPAFAREIVSTATILMEIKRYSRTF